MRLLNLFPVTGLSRIHHIMFTETTLLLRRYNYKISVSLDFHIDNVNIISIINKSFLGIIPNI